jgi:hypothetical protein
MNSPHQLRPEIKGALGQRYKFSFENYTEGLRFQTIFAGFQNVAL